MFRTLPRPKMISTAGGMRRILKNKGSVIDYIRDAVESGVYRTNEELEKVKKERRDSADDLQTIMYRFRHDIVRGSSVHDYPTEYLILQQHPPIPDPPRTPVKLLKRMRAPPNPTERLAKKYMEKQRGTEEQAGEEPFEGEASGAPNTAQEYYRRLLGVPAPPVSSALGQKTAAVQKAYAVAVKQYQLQRTAGLSEGEALRQVEELLAVQDRNERVLSRERANRTKQFFKGRNKSETLQSLFEIEHTEDTTDSTSDASDSSSRQHLESIFNANPRTVEGMMRWSERLAAVPYREWTIGASTSLDHWIARQLLGLSEETWQSLLEGDDVSLLSQGRDIVAVRESLFPETMLELPQDEIPDEITPNPREEGVDDETPVEKSIEELLASLGGLRGDDSADEGLKTSNKGWKWPEEEDAGDLDSRVQRLVVELQEWRRKNLNQKHKDWEQREKAEFMAWVKKYVETLASSTERGQVDYESTGQALLADPPVSQEESDDFWDHLSEEESVRVLLDAMRTDGPPKGATILQSAFWDLPTETQIERLLNLGELRPLLNEYTKESERLAFLQRHGETLLAGVVLEHLVPDPNGPVLAKDVGGLAEEAGFPPGSRFRLEMIPYSSATDVPSHQHTRALYNAWNQHKAGRARYEEKMFQTGRLGLRYSDKIPKDDFEE